MKKYILFIVLSLLFGYQQQDVIRSFFYTPPDYAAAHNVDVIMYGTSWCSYCAKTRALLEKNNVTYYEYNIETSQEGHKQFVDLGGRGIPFLQIGGQVVKGYRPSRILELINEI